MKIRNIKQDLVILHGWNGSGEHSSTVNRLVTRLERAQPKTAHNEITKFQLVSPTLDYSNPYTTVRQLRELVATLNNGTAIIGISFGGYWARWLANIFPNKFSNLILVNASLDAPINTRKYIGINTNSYTGETYEFTEQNCSSLENYRVDGDRNNLAITAIVAHDDDIVDPTTVERMVGKDRAKIHYVVGGHQLKENDEWLDIVEKELNNIW